MTRSAPPLSIDERLRQAPVQASAAERHLWWIDLLGWIRQGEPVSGVQYLLRRTEDDPQAREAVVQLLAHSLQPLPMSSLLADLGFAPRAALFSELGERLKKRLLPTTPDTRDLGALFDLLFQPADVVWVNALDHATLDRLADLFHEAWGLSSPQGWQGACLDALSILASHIRSVGLSKELRFRLADDTEADPAAAFLQLARAAEDFRDVMDTGEQTQVLQQAQYLRALVDRCAALADGVHAHLEAYGVSVDVVFLIDQLKLRCQRMDQLLACLLSPQPAQEARALWSALVQQEDERHGIRSLLTQHYSLLARLVAERSAETGEHYITRTRAEYRDMLRRAAGGGLVIAGTTFGKFFLSALGLSAFWTGFATGANYAASFVLIHLLHWTVATKQPAMTAPALAAKLRRTNDDAEVQAFVDEVAHLMRSQVAGILGNLLVVAPVVLLIQWLAWQFWGHPLTSEAQATYSLKSLTLLGPTALFAAFTGVLLFISSLIAGWFENWFVWHRLDSALQWHPRARAWLGAERAARWAQWWRQNVSGMAANISLGFLLGLTPALAGFFGLPIEVRHVTLSTGQLAAALGTFGLPLLQDPVFWWGVAAIPITGLLNVGVSFALALRVAMRSRGVKIKDQWRLVRAVLAGLRQQPGRFVLPPRTETSTSASSHG